MTILRPTPQDYDELLAVWEASVRSTHHFLTEENILPSRRALHHPEPGRKNRRLHGTER